MFWLGIVAAIITWIIYDLTQRSHAILRNFPIVGHFRYWLESVGPELRQYIVTGNDEERPFSRDQRRWVYASSKKANSYFGFGSDNDMEARSNYLIVKHVAFPLEMARPGQTGYDPMFPVPGAKILGGARRRSASFRPPSIVNVSAMSYGSLSGPAVGTYATCRHACATPWRRSGRPAGGRRFPARCRLGGGREARDVRQAGGHASDSVEIVEKHGGRIPLSADE